MLGMQAKELVKHVTWNVESRSMSVVCASRDVLGLDATAAQTLGSLWGSLRGADVELVLTGVRRTSMLRLLQVCSEQKGRDMRAQVVTHKRKACNMIADWIQLPGCNCLVLSSFVGEDRMCI